MTFEQRPSRDQQASHEGIWCKYLAGRESSQHPAPSQDQVWGMGGTERKLAWQEEAESTQTSCRRESVFSLIGNYENFSFDSNVENH